MTFIGDLFGGGDHTGPLDSMNTALANAKKAGETKPTVIDNPPQKPPKPLADKVGGSDIDLGGGDALLGGSQSLTG